jgi:Ca2+-binding EF-hand superfamily protein
MILKKNAKNILDYLIEKIQDPSTLIRSVGTYPTEKQVEELCKQYGSKGKVSKEDFFKVMPELLKETVPDLKEAFTAFDPDGTGLVNTRELINSLTSIGERLKDEEVMEVFKICGVDATQKELKWQEFAENLVKPPVQGPPYNGEPLDYTLDTI